MLLRYYYYDVFLGDKEKRNIGLGLRSNRGKGKESSGYTKRVDGDKSEWFYSSKLQDDVEKYMDEFPEVFEYLYDQLSGSEDDLHLAAADIWPEDEVRQNVDRLSKFLKELPCSKVFKYNYLNCKPYFSRRQCKNVVASVSIKTKLILL